MKFVIETGSGSHTTSSASVQAYFVGGEFDGHPLYQHREFQSGKPEWDTSRTNEKWVTTVYELPEGTQISIVGKGRTGDRGSKKHAYHRIYQLDHEADVLEGDVPVGLRNCTFKGRLVLVRDVLKDQEAAAKANKEEGF